MGFRWASNNCNRSSFSYQFKQKDRCVDETNEQFQEEKETRIKILQKLRIVRRT